MIEFGIYLNGTVKAVTADCNIVAAVLGQFQEGAVVEIEAGEDRTGGRLTPLGLVSLVQWCNWKQTGQFLFNPVHVAAAFSSVSDLNDWQGPVNKVIQSSERFIVETAVKSFTQAPVVFTPGPELFTLTVRSIGYRDQLAAKERPRSLSTQGPSIQLPNPQQLPQAPS